jgi:hypothetical protein
VSTTPEQPAPEPPAPELAEPQPAAEQAPPPRRRPGPAARDDAIDLGTTVLPVLLKTYWKQGLALIVAVAVLIWWVARG